MYGIFRARLTIPSIIRSKSRVVCLFHPNRYAVPGVGGVMCVLWLCGFRICISYTSHPITNPNPDPHPGRNDLQRDGRLLSFSSRPPAWCKVPKHHYTFIPYTFSFSFLSTAVTGYSSVGCFDRPCIAYIGQDGRWPHTFMGYAFLFFPADVVALAGELRGIVFGQCDSVVSS